MGKWLPKEEWLKKQTLEKSNRKKNVCAFNDYEEVTNEMVDRFWSNEKYCDKLINVKNIRDEWKDAYEKAKKNVAMLDYAMSPDYTVHFDKEGNLFIEVNHGCSWSSQNHLHHYAGKYYKYFTLKTAAGAALDNNIYELLYN